MRGAGGISLVMRSTLRLLRLIILVIPFVASICVMLLMFTCEVMITLLSTFIKQVYELFSELGLPIPGRPEPDDE